MKIISLISREWSYEITKKIIKDSDKSINFCLLITKNVLINKGKYKHINIKKTLSSNHLKTIKSFKPDLILAYGWSDYMSKDLRRIAPCLILHPSKLPKYRGGSPIQNQILNGIKKSAVSILYAEDDIDSGEILFQEEISLEGYLNDIFKRMINKGVKGTKKILKLSKLKSYSQNHKYATYYKRRKPIQSKISLKDIKKFEAEYFFNLVRGLQDPYPLAYIECKNKTKLYLKKVLIKKK